MKIELSTHFSKEERDIINPNWDGSKSWRDDEHFYEIEVSDSLDTDKELLKNTQAPHLDIKGKPLRLVWVDIEYFLEVKEDSGEISWYICDGYPMTPCGKYKTLKEIMHAL